MTILDLRCLDDLDDLAEEITDPFESLFQDNYHRLIDPPGSNLDDKNWGLGIKRFLSASTSLSQRQEAAVNLASLASRIEAELRKDDRNAEVRARVTPTANRGEYSITVVWVPDPDLVGTPEKQQIMNLRGGAGGVELV